VRWSRDSECLSDNSKTEDLCSKIVETTIIRSLTCVAKREDEVPSDDCSLFVLNLAEHGEYCISAMA